MRKVVALGAGLALAVTAGCGGDGGDEKKSTSAPATAPSGVYFGAVAMTTDRLAVAFDNTGNSGKVTAFLTDGEPGGDAEWFEGEADKATFSLTSASGKARIEGTVEPAETTGTVTLADGVKRAFHTIPATHGAGIYDVTVSADGHYTGTSTDGSTMDARQNGDYVEGKITTKGGEQVMYRNVDLSRVFSYDVLGGQADHYTMVVSRHGLVQMGRGGDGLKQGRPDPNIVALDLAASGIPTEGIYYGRLARTVHQLAISVDLADGQGNRRLRMYVSDGLPGGDIEWFVGTVPSSGVIDLPSADKKAALRGQLSASDAHGTVTLARGDQHPFFAVPAGDGAGIYDIDVSADKHYTGTSEKGEKLDLSQTGHDITGTITTPNGRTVTVIAYDLTDVFHYGQEGSKPDHYVAFASPGGRYFIGRSGDVRGGQFGSNIIGLDKAC
jgi:hypothetical protein